MNLLIKGLRGEARERKYLILAALSFGLLFYIYLYAWSYILAINLILGGLYLIKRDTGRFKRVALITFWGLAAGSYNLYNIYSALHSEIGRRLLYFFGASYGRTPAFDMINFAPLLLFAAFIYVSRKSGEEKAEREENWPVVLALILGGWAVMNQQIITGRVLQPAHYYDVFLAPMAIIVSLYMLSRVFSFKKVILIFLLIAVYANTAIGQYMAALTVYDLKIYRQNYRPLIDVLNKNKDAGVILTAGDDAGYLFTVYTSYDLFWSQPFSAINVPIKRIKDALYVYAYLNRETKLNPEMPCCGDIYKTLEGFTSGLTARDYSRKLIQNDPEILRGREQLLSELNREYSEISRRKEGVKDLLKSYGIDYIVHDRNLYPEWDLSVLAGLQQIAVSNDIYLYKIAK